MKSSFMFALTGLAGLSLAIRPRLCSAHLPSLNHSPVSDDTVLQTDF